MKKRTLFFGVFIAALAIGLTGCPARKRIADIQGDPARYMDKEVTVVGKVVRSYGGGPFGIYEIDDGTAGKVPRPFQTELLGKPPGGSEPPGGL